MIIESNEVFSVLFECQERWDNQVVSPPLVTDSNCKDLVSLNQKYVKSIFQLPHEPPTRDKLLVSQSEHQSQPYGCLVGILE